MRRTLEGTKIKRQHVSGFRARMATPGGQEVLNRRRAKGRHQIFIPFSSGGVVGSSRLCNFIYPFAPPQQFLNFFPLPHGQGSFRPTFSVITGAAGFGSEIYSNISENAFEQNRIVADE